MKLCGGYVSGDGDSETGQSVGQGAHPASWPESSAGANLIVDRRSLAYSISVNVHVLLVKVEKSGSVQHRQIVEGPQQEKTLESEGSDDVTAPVVVVPVTMMCFKVSKTSEWTSHTANLLRDKSYYNRHL